MRTTLLVLAAAVFAVLAVAGPTFAHHGAAAYDMKDTVTVMGTVTDFEFVNPHCQVYFDVKNDKSDQLRVVERFHRLDRDHLELQVTMIDPKALAKPWVGMLYYEFRPDWELGEISCAGDYLDFNKFEDPKIVVKPYNK
jgi:hypothetical protein